jgi:hypothetical protein
MKRKFLLFGLVAALTFGLSSCLHAPKQAWTPSHTKSGMKAQKPKNGKAHKKKKIRAIKMW